MMAMLVSKNKKMRFILTPSSKNNAVDNTLSGNPHFCWAYICLFLIGYWAQ
jgi:hypothetical protein